MIAINGSSGFQKTWIAQFGAVVIQLAPPAGVVERQDGNRGPLRGFHRLDRAFAGRGDYGFVLHALAPRHPHSAARLQYAANVAQHAKRLGISQAPEHVTLSKLFGGTDLR